MSTEIRQGYFWIRRKKKKILITLTGFRGIKPLHPELVIVLKEDGGIAVDPDWEKELAVKTMHVDAWRAVLDKLDLPLLVFRRLDAAPPPRSLLKESQRDPQSAMVEYLRDIASGKIPVRGFGHTGKSILAQSLSATFPVRTK